MKRVKIIGLTGQSGAGKSTAAQVFEQNGFAVINADSLVKRVYEQNEYCLDAVSHPEAYRTERAYGETYRYAADSRFTLL